MTIPMSGRIVQMNVLSKETNLRGTYSIWPSFYDIAMGI